jgi:hypothetical protein
MAETTKKTISIQEVIAAIGDDEAVSKRRTFSISFVRAEKSERRGTIKTIERARYGYPRSEFQRLNKGLRNKIKGRRLHIDAGTLPITDVTEGRYNTPLISHIIGYNGMKVIH